MQVYTSIEQFERLPNAVVTTGTFDGVHVGHRRIMSRVLEICHQTRGESVVLTFWPHPRLVVSDRTTNLFLLSTIEEKIELFRSLGIQHLIILPFTRAFSELTPEEYIQKILVEAIGTRTLVIGYDHKFGKNRAGDFDFLTATSASFGFRVEEIPRQDIDALAISSSRIRLALAEGQVEIANELLGRPYSLSGQVVKGQQLGRKLGFPTANIAPSAPYKLIPSDGVYAGEVHVRSRSYPAVINIGQRPTVSGEGRSIEAHLLDFAGDIYGEECVLILKKYLRPEQRFDSLEALKNQINRDVSRAREELQVG
jgi:riboflavin kinase/FMN adenylyltransferase